MARHCDVDCDVVIAAPMLSEVVEKTDADDVISLSPTRNLVIESRRRQPANCTASLDAYVNRREMFLLSKNFGDSE